MDKPDSHAQLVELEIERLRLQNPRWKAAKYFVERFFIRLLRIVSGLALAGIAIYLYDIASAKTSIAFAALTIKDLAAVLFGFGGALLFITWALHLAFGKAPQRPSQNEKALRIEAESIVSAKEHAEAARAAVSAKESERVATWYRRGRMLGLLFDPSLARRHKWIPFVAVLAAYGILAAVISFASAGHN